MTDTPGSLSGRTALVTGSGRNIGKAIAVTLAREGANVVFNGHRDQAALDEAVTAVVESGGQAISVLADVSDFDDVDRMAATAEEAFGSIDIAISNVALRRHQPFESITEEDWRRVLGTNLDSAFFLAKRVLPGMKQRGWGRIIHISGLDGFTGHYPDRAHNIVCKMGLVGLAKAIAQEYGTHGVTANIVAPGAIDTERDWSQYVHFKPQEVVREIPVRRIGTVEDVAAACSYLASEAGSFITGQTIHVNGGQYMF